ncbi:MAG: ribosomal protein [Planctomycetota bacterium]|jgi:small subunit ribosomal protein S1
MTTDPTQPESSASDVPAVAAAPETASESSILQQAAQLQAAALGDALPDAAPADASGDSETTGARIRERMTSATESLPQPVQTETAAPAKESRSGRIEIPAADELESTLAAEIAAAQSVDTSVPVTVGGEEEPAPEGTETTAAKSVGSGSKVRGTVQAIHGGEVFLDAGLRQNVVLQLTQFPEGKQPAVGDSLEVIIDAEDADGLIKGRIPRARHRASGNWEALAAGQVVDCMVTAVNKGGLQVSVSNLRGFLPASQVEMGFAGNLEQYVGQKLTVQITEVNPKKRNLVVSRRSLLQAERAEGEGAFWAQVEVGQSYTGTVKTLKDYGAFINIGPVDGFLHIGEISWARINHPRDVLAEGQQLEVKVLKLDPEKKRISLGLKQLALNPWASAAERYATGSVVTGTVTRLAEFGAFVELEAGLEGMVHISELAWRRVSSVGEILKVGDSREFQVVEVDTKRKRVSLSVKALEKRPEPPRTEKPADEPETPAEEPRKPRNSNLRGGTGTSAGGRGLFGNPSDFT